MSRLLLPLVAGLAACGVEPTVDLATSRQDAQTPPECRFADTTCISVVVPELVGAPSRLVVYQVRRVGNTEVYVRLLSIDHPTLTANKEYPIVLRAVTEPFFVRLVLERHATLNHGALDSAPHAVAAGPLVSPELDVGDIRITHWSFEHHTDHARALEPSAIAGQRLSPAQRPNVDDALLDAELRACWESDLIQPGSTGLVELHPCE